MKRILLSILAIGILLLSSCGTPAAEPPATYTLSVSVNPLGAGSVSPSDGQYEEGTQVTLTTTPASGYTFDYWGGDASGSLPTITITMDSNKSVTAYFQLIPEPEPIEFSGQGDDVSSKFTLEEGITIITMTHSGESNFAIKLLDNTGGLVDLLVNEIGVFDGSVAIGVREDNIIGAKPGIHLLDITADSSWTVLIEQPRPTSAKALPISINGKGCGVSPFFVLDEGLTIFNMTHDGDSNFAITLLSVDGKVAELLVNEIGSYSGKKAVGVKQGNIIGARPGMHILSITADGNWTVSISE